MSVGSYHAQARLVCTQPLVKPPIRVEQNLPGQRRWRHIGVHHRIEAQPAAAGIRGRPQCWERGDELGRWVAAQKDEDSGIQADELL